MTAVSLNPSQPYAVPANIGFVELVITGTNDPLPSAVPIFVASHAPAKVALRLAGGCSNMSQSDKRNMLDFFGSGLEHFTGMVSSGGTREANADGLLDPMVTDVPALLVQQSPESIVAVSSVPRTNRLGLVDDSRLVLSEDGKLLPNPGVHMIVLVQSNNGVALDWDGDLDMYFDMFRNLVVHGKWQVGMIVYNGGGVTRTEALRAMMHQWPVILVQNSGRQADVLIQELQAGTLVLPNGAEPTLERIQIVQNDDHRRLHGACVTQQLIAV